MIIKSKHKISSRTSEAGFRLQKMSDIYDRAEGKSDVPHRHDYFTVLFVENAEGTHIIDYKKFSFSKLQVHFINPGQVHQVALLKRPKGYVISFTKEFLVWNNIPESFISNINLFQAFGHSPPLELDSVNFKRVHELIKEMGNCLAHNLTYRNRALGALLQLFLIYCSNSTKMDQDQLDEDNSGICILRDFKSLVDKKFKDWHKVKEYANQIHVSAKHLSQTVRQLSGKSAKNIIQDRIILESKRLLIHTEKSVKEISYSLGFEEPVHFSAFFKKEVGHSPLSFRKQAKN